MILQVELPEYTDIVKTARFKELAPYDPDWYYVRAGMRFIVLYTNGICLICKILCFFFFFLMTWEMFSAASVARKIYLRGGLGVGAFRRIYGGSKRNGSRPPHFCRSGGAILRHILQQLQNMNIIDLDPKG